MQIFFLLAFLLEPMTFHGRVGQTPLYQAKVPSDWEKISPAKDLSNTMLPIYSFKIEEILLTIHNFPSPRIPPKAQVERWIKQFRPSEQEISQVAHGGFGGLRIEASNLEGKAMMGYAMQMSDFLCKQVSQSEITSDYTIKAVGPIDAIESHREEIDAFAESFELVDPLPCPL